MAPSATSTVTQDEEPKYEYYYYNGKYGHRRQVLTGPDSHKTFQEIPIIDISPVFSPSPEKRQEIAAKVADVCQNIGFMLIKNHGVDEKLIEDVYGQAKWFFDRVMEEKEEVGIYRNEGLRGYEGLYGARLDESLRKGGECFSSCLKNVRGRTDD